MTARILASAVPLVVKGAARWKLLVKPVVLLLLLAVPTSAFADDPPTSVVPSIDTVPPESIAASTTESRSLVTFSRNNYFLAGFNRHNQVKFQIAFKYELWASDDATGGPHAVFFAYSQRSLWRIWDHSSPFEENDYNPELFYTHWHHPGRVPPTGCSLFRERAGVEHESNGLGVPGSRSLNRTYGEGQLLCYAPSSAFFMTTLKLWGYPWGIGENDTEPLYAGPGELSVMAGVDDQGRWYGFGDATVLFRKGLRDWRSAVQIDLRWHPSRSSFAGRMWPLNAFFYAQFFSGYRETLYKFNVNDTTFRVGVGFAPRERRFEQ